MLYNLIKLLGNRYAGFFLSLVVAINLAIGSLVMNANSDLYPPFFPFDLRFFFEPVLPVHSWLYALLVTLSLFAINLAACTVESVVNLLESTGNRTRPIAALCFHVALLLTLGAHLYDGFYGSSEQTMLIPSPEPVAGIGEVDLLELNNLYHPDGSLKDTHVRLRATLPSGVVREELITYNEPALFAGGMKEIIIQSGDHQPAGMYLASERDGTEIRLMYNAPYPLNGGRLILFRIVPTDMGIMVAQVGWEPPEGEKQMFIMAMDQAMSAHNKLLIDGTTYRYRESIKVPVAAVMVRHNPSIPLVMVALLTSIAGLILLSIYIRSQREARRS